MFHVVPSVIVTKLSTVPTHANVKMAFFGIMARVRVSVMYNC
jgi:hypothetical protein